MGEELILLVSGYFYVESPDHSLYKSFMEKVVGDGKVVCETSLKNREVLGGAARGYDVMQRIVIS